ncbi:hypothetical protein [Chelativorans salis]|uniref:Uncharacterized protein n=1 Tax=Chelativorans salis TaxID=2978478 RepID=A0ABT2LQU2_9HYPH|nr:hypothetical protein [Chelativorans sp. EGI FJ00035]MCT7375738.1 hypothetical protein [Chelativorans sp. EGI FJ00035]
MDAPPDKRKPVLPQTGFLENKSRLNNPEITEAAPLLQAIRVRQRFGVSWPLARTIADLAYSAGGTA